MRSSSASGCAIRRSSSADSIGPTSRSVWITFQTEDDKLSGLIRRVRFAEKPGIVYVATRKNAETIMGLLQEEGIAALFYHAGLKVAGEARSSRIGS